LKFLAEHFLSDASLRRFIGVPRCSSFDTKQVENLFRHTNAQGRKKYGFDTSKVNKGRKVRLWKLVLSVPLPFNKKNNILRI